MDSLTLEYTYLLTSQLESQRRYFTEQLAQRESEARAHTEALERRVAQLDVENRRLVANQRALQTKYETASKNLAEETQVSVVVFQIPSFAICFLSVVPVFMMSVNRTAAKVT